METNTGGNECSELRVTSLRIFVLQSSVHYICNQQVREQVHWMCTVNKLHHVCAMWVALVQCALIVPLR